jgi:hypothetical protein
MIKIDQSFVRDMLIDPNDLGIVDSVVRLARAFNRPVIAEGVETMEHGDILLKLGCQLAQGYGVARPMPASQFAQWTREWSATAAWKNRPAIATAVIDLPLLTAKRSHEAWMDALIAQLDCGETTAQVVSDSTACGFGAWYSSNGLARYGQLPSFHRIGPLHEQVHAFAHELCGQSAVQHPPASSHQRMALLDASRQLTLAMDALLLEAQSLPGQGLNDV